MRMRYSEFRHKRTKEGYIEFSGILRVKPELPEYSISILYRQNISPEVRILSPKLDKNPPHYYKESQTLCLYHPKLFQWKKTRLVADEIMLWTAGWIYFYELWLQTGEWFGPNAHDGIVSSEI